METPHIDIPRMVEDAFLSGLTSQRWADKAGLSCMTVNRLRKGAVPKPDTLKKLAKALGRSLRYYKAAHKASVPRRAGRAPLNHLRCSR